MKVPRARKQAGGKTAMRETRYGAYSLLGAVLLIAATKGLGAAGDAGAEAFQEGRAAYDRGDVVAAIEHLNQAANAGHVRAMALLGYVLDKSEENTAAVRMYQRAADLGDAEALLALGVMYANGEGVEKNTESAVSLIEQAATVGYGPAIVTLANAYLKGSLGLGIDKRVARQWLERGAALGYEPARQELAKLESSAVTPAR